MCKKNLVYFCTVKNGVVHLYQINALTGKREQIQVPQ